METGSSSEISFALEKRHSDESTSLPNQVQKTVRSVVLSIITSICLVVASFVASLAASQKAVNIVSSVLECAVAAAVFSFGVCGIHRKDQRLLGVFGAFAICMSILQIVWILFGVYNTSLYTAQLNAEGGQAGDSSILQSLIVASAIQASTALMSGITYACCSATSFKLKKLLSQQVQQVQPGENTKRKTLSVPSPFT